jgi:hypothetical protein
VDENVHRVSKTTSEMKSHHSHPTRVHTEGKEKINEHEIL